MLKFKHNNINGQFVVSTTVNSQFQFVLDCSYSKSEVMERQSGYTMSAYHLHKSLGWKCLA